MIENKCRNTPKREPKRLAKIRVITNYSMIVGKKKLTGRPKDEVGVRVGTGLVG